MSGGLFAFGATPPYACCGWEFVNGGSDETDRSQFPTSAYRNE